MADWKNEKEYWNDLRESVRIAVDETITEHGRQYPGDGEYDGENLRELCRDAIRELAENYCIYYYTTRQIIVYTSHVDAIDQIGEFFRAEHDALTAIGKIAYWAILADLEELLEINDQYQELTEKETI